MTVRYSPRSLRDIGGIRTYIAKKSGGWVVADRYVSAMFDECRHLAVLPERYPAYPFAPQWRMMPFGNYLVFFQVRSGEVRIGHVRHAARRTFRG